MEYLPRANGFQMRDKAPATSLTTKLGRSLGPVKLITYANIWKRLFPHGPPAQGRYLPDSTLPQTQRQ